MELTAIGDLNKLTPPERLDLISRLWDSLDADHVPVTTAQREELDRRLLTLDEDLKAGTPWETLREEMSNRYR